MIYLCIYLFSQQPLSPRERKKFLKPSLVEDHLHAHVLVFGVFGAAIPPMVRSWLGKQSEWGVSQACVRVSVNSILLLLFLFQL